MFNSLNRLMKKRGVKKMINNKLRDEKIFELIEKEKERQERNIELIASENFVSNEVMEAQGSVLTNKYAEGYPRKRYYGGCQWVDEVEQLAIDRAKELFGAEYANVQPHSGSQANNAVFQAFLQPGDTFMGMNLSEGGHLTHGSPVNFSGKIYNAVHYGVDPETEMVDYDRVRELALEHRPKMIIAGFSAYSRQLDFKKFREIADEIGAILMVDMAHVAGLVATGLYPSPIPYADVVTTTTHKTLRGPRGGMILAKKEHAKKLRSAVFPGSQGGPLEHVIAAKAVSFYEALQDEFKDYCAQILKNAKAMEAVFNASDKARIITGGTDDHLLLIDVRGYGLTGKDAEETLDRIHITANKNTIPNETESPFITSGIRIGTPAMTTRGFKEAEFTEVAEIIDAALSHANDEAKLDELAQQVLNLTERIPLYK